MAMPKGQKANIGPENGHPQHTHTHTHPPLQVCIKKGAAMRGRGAVCNCVSQQDCRDIYINMTSCHTITHFLSLSLLIIIIIIVFVGCVYFYLFFFLCWCWCFVLLFGQSRSSLFLAGQPEQYDYDYWSVLLAKGLSHSST